MSGKQLLMLVLVTSVTFLGILGAGGYLYYTSPETLGLPKRVVPGDTVKQPSPIELEAQRLRNQNDSLAKKMQTFTDSLSKEKVRTDSLKNVAQSLSSQVTSQEKQQKAAQQKAEKDTLRLKNMQAFAEMYDKADPEGDPQFIEHERRDNVNPSPILHPFLQRFAGNVVECLDVLVADLPQHEFEGRSSTLIHRLFDV